MWLLKLLISFPLLILFIIFLIENNELVSLWPLTSMDWFPVKEIGTSVIYLILFCLGYALGRLSGWFSNAPLRMMLRQQKKENKVLSKEHEKLNHQHEKLNQQYTTLQVEAEKTDKAHKFSLSKKIKGWFASTPAKED